MKRYWWIIGIVSSFVENCPDKCECTSNHDDGTYVDCRGREIGSIPQYFPKDARIIDLSQNNIKMIDEFPVLDELAVLNLTDNKIEEIEVDAFEDLERLSTLVLSRNNIRFIEDDIFEWGPDNLRHLYLDHNKLETIKHYVFLSLEKLEELDLSSNLLYFIDNHAFDDLEHLRSVKLHDNKLKTFRPKWIVDGLFHSLQELTFHANPWSCDCGFRAFYDELVHNSDNRDIFQNALLAGASSVMCHGPPEYANKNAFSITGEELDVKCKAPTITKVTQDHELSMGQPIVLRCEAEGLPPPLIEWRAPNGDIYKVTNDDFVAVIVHYDGTLLITDGADEVDDGEYHCVAKNKMGSAEAEVVVTVRKSGSVYPHQTLCGYDPETHRFAPESSGTINLPRCSNVPEIATHLPVVSNPSTEYVETNCPDKCTCDWDTAVCSNQQQLFLPNSLPDHVVHLDFTNNWVDGLSRDLCYNYNQLRILMMDANRITSIDSAAFRSCQNMEKLILKSNRINKIAPSQFDSLRKLQILDLSENGLTQLPANAFEGLPNLEKVYLRDNIISHIDPMAFNSLDCLEYIYLQGNKLYHVRRDWIFVVSNLGNKRPEDCPMNNKPTSVSVSAIFLDENQIECDCNLAPFKADFSDPYSKVFKVLQPDELRCAYPRSLTGKKLTEIEVDKLTCLADMFQEDPIKRSHFGVFGFIVGIILTTLVFFFYPKYKRYRVTQNFPSRPHGGINDDMESDLAPLIGPPVISQHTNNTEVFA